MYRSPDVSSTANWSAVLRFPSVALVEELYDSDDYAPYIEIQNGLTDFACIVFIDGMYVKLRELRQRRRRH
jgi:uncharacterized protein (DUF1330 family)